MCGIIGYVGDREVAKLLITGLKKLEYRGYDSYGICVKDENNFKILKRKGKISENNLNLNEFSGNLGIAHTRWATHGKPTQINSHPHFNCKKDISIVHNGIIENANALRKMLIKEKHKFVSQTDSEVVAHLIEKFYSGNLEIATRKAVSLLEGSFALGIISKNDDFILATRRGSPLVIGIGKNENFIASDVVPILKYTKKIIYLKDNEMAKISKNKVEIKNVVGKIIDKKIHEIKWTIKEAEKGKFKHFMIKEIFEQPEVIKNVLRGRIKDNKIKLTLNTNFKKINKIILTACGTSWHACLIGKTLIEKYTRIPVEVDYASEFRYRNPLVEKNNLLIAVSQSGETADTIAAIKEAKRKGAKTLGIVNVVGSTISREVETGMYLYAGPETGVASTKAFTSQIMALFLLALHIRQEKKLPIDKRLINEIQKVPEKIKEALKEATKIKKIAKRFVNSKNFLYFGRGINYPVALEGALKLKEISYIHAEGYPAAEMKHGPIALIDENMPSVFIATHSRTFKKLISNIEEVKARGGKIISLVNKEDKLARKYSDFVIDTPRTVEDLSAIVNTIPLQLLSYFVADMKGLDVDKPRNLAKSVTVE